MIEAHEVSAQPSDRRLETGLSLKDLLVDGGDGRLALDPITGRNRYGCCPGPDPQLADFGSSTASVISTTGYAAAEALRQRLYGFDPRGPSAGVYAQELQRLRGSLIDLCGLSDIGGLDVIFSPSGTDLHMLVAELVGATPGSPLVCVDVEPEETGSGVPAALSGQHFGANAALGAPVLEGASVGPESRRFVAVRCRAADGTLRPSAEIEAELDVLGREVTGAGARLLLAVSDVSKTGLISPGLDVVLAFKQRFGAAAEILIDACQFRLSPESLRAYLGHGFMVAVTGSKFLTGPSFSGGVFVPPETAERLRGRLIASGLRAYSARGEWPQGWVAAKAMSETVNVGLMLRWEAAVSELVAFRALPTPAVDAFAQRFAGAVQAWISANAQFEALEARGLDRAAIGGRAQGWDVTPTIFPFLLKHTDGRGYLSLAATQDVYRGLCAEPFPPRAGQSRARLGQPVKCGARDDRPISALRLCNSARLMVEAVTGGEAGAQAVIDRAVAVLERTAEGAKRLSLSGRI